MSELAQNGIIKERKGTSFSIKSIILCGIFTALIAVGAFIRVPLPLIPFTMQFPFVALCAIILGSRLSFWSTLAYLLIGLVGFPVFTKGGGIGYVFEPTFGFLIGFAVSAIIIGKIIEKKGNYRFLTIFAACVAGILASYICGVVYMYLILNLYIGSSITFWNALWGGALVFLPKDLILCAGIAFLATKLMPALKKSKLI